MSTSLVIALALSAALLGAVLGWFASLFWGRPPLPAAPTPVDALANNVTTQIGYLHDDVLTLHRAVETWSEHSTAAIAALRTDVIARQEEMGVRLTAVEVRTVDLSADVAKLTMAFDRMSAWEPGRELENPAQLVRFMNESSADRAKLRDDMMGLRTLVRAMVISMVLLAPMVVTIFVRVVYLILGGA